MNESKEGDERGDKEAREERWRKNHDEGEGAKKGRKREGERKKIEGERRSEKKWKCFNKWMWKVVKIFQEKNYWTKSRDSLPLFLSLWGRSYEESERKKEKKIVKHIKICINIKQIMRTLNIAISVWLDNKKLALKKPKY